MIKMKYLIFIISILLIQKIFLEQQYKKFIEKKIFTSLSVFFLMTVMLSSCRESIKIFHNFTINKYFNH